MPIHNRFVRNKDGSLSSQGLIDLGAYLTVEIHVPLAIAKVLTDRGEPIPAPVTGAALIDTGATMTCIHEPILRDQLKLNPLGVINAGTANGPTKQNVYPVRLVATAPLQFTLDMDGVAGVDLSGQVIRTSPTHQPVIALLGRNFLRFGIFIWNGAGGFWTLAIG